MGYTTARFTPDLERYARQEKRKRRKLEVDGAGTSTETRVDHGVAGIEVNDGDEDGQAGTNDEVAEATVEVATQTNSMFMQKYHEMETELALLKQNNQVLLNEKAYLKQQFDQVSLFAQLLKSNEDKLKFYTGKKEYNTVMIVLKYIYYYRYSRVACFRSIV